MSEITPKKKKKVAPKPLYLTGDGIKPDPRWQEKMEEYVRAMTEQRAAAEQMQMANYANHFTVAGSGTYYGGHPYNPPQHNPYQPNWHYNANPPFQVHANTLNWTVKPAPMTEQDKATQRRYHPSDNGVFFPCE